MPPSVHPWVYHRPPSVTVSAPVGLLVCLRNGDEALGSNPGIIVKKEGITRRRVLHPVRVISQLCAELLRSSR